MHIGVHPPRQAGFHFAVVTLPVVQITPAQMLGLADLSDRFDSGEIRHTVWQSLILPNVRTSAVDTLVAEIRALGLDARQSNVTGGVIACTGNRYCKFAATDTKGHALALSEYLSERLTLDQPINIHLDRLSPLLRSSLANRQAGETFQAFTTRHDTQRLLDLMRQVA